MRGKEVNAMIACFDASMGSCRTACEAPVGGQRIGSVGPTRVHAVDPADRFALGAPCVIPRDAPDPARYPAGKSDADIRSLLAAKSRRREEGIRRLIEEAKASGREIERFVAAINYDTELSPRTTNRRQLLELGIEVPSADAMPADDAEVHRVLWTIVYGLARLGIFLTGTDSLDDRAMLARLCSQVLVDEVPDIPPSADMSEFIDLDAPVALDAPDGLHGPFDPSREEDEEVDGALLEIRGEPIVDRDRLLPKPDRS